MPKLLLEITPEHTTVSTKLMEMQHRGWNFTSVKITKTHEPSSHNTEKKRLVLSPVSSQPTGH